MNQLPFGTPFSITAKPAGSACNLRCKYCYYLEKEKFYNKGESHLMNSETLEHFIREYILSQPSDTVVFNWHGGEALLRPLEYYKKIIALQTKYGEGRNISNTIQTNGTLLNEDWARFFRKYNFLVGLSIDGPKEFHDLYRVTKNGTSSFDAVMRGIKILNKYNVEWNILATVNAANADHPVETYNFLKNLGTQFIQFTPVVERIKPDGMLANQSESDGLLADFSVKPIQWGKFMCKVYDEWVKTDVGTVFVQLFDATLANKMGLQPPVCTMAKDCGDALAIEYNGDVYSCDHFVFPNYKLGNIHRDPFWRMVMNNRQKDFGSAKSNSLPKKCRDCEYLWACHGECPRNRFIVTEEPGKNLNYLCEGYKMFFKHVSDDIEFMKKELEAQRAPSNIMKLKN